MSLDSEYRVERLSEKNMRDLLPLYKDAFGHSKSLAEVQSKFATAFSGASMLAHIAYAANGQAAAFYALFPVKYLINNREIIAAQVGDLMTHSAHRRKGLYIHLANITHEVAYAEGVELIFTIPSRQVESSYSGFVNRLNFEHIHSWHSFFIKVQSFPLAMLLNKSRLTKKLYSFYTGVIVRLVSQSPLRFNHVSNVTCGQVVKSGAFIQYKLGYQKSFFIAAGGHMVWLKVTGNVLKIGDIQRLSTVDLQKIIARVKMLAFVLGIRVIQFETSPDEYWDTHFSALYPSIANYHICVLNQFGLNTNDIKFILADIDSY